MKKKLVVLALVMACAFTTACGKATPEGTETAETTENAGSVVVIPETNKYGTVTLGKYKGIEVEKKVYTITEEQIDAEVAMLLESNQDMEKVSRPAEKGDYIEFYFTSSIDGETIFDYSGEIYFMTLGEEELGSEMDEKLLGAKTGDDMTFSIKYDDTAYEAVYQNKTVDFSVKVEGVYEIKTPELTEEFITNNLGYKSEQDMRDQLKEQLEEKADENSRYELEGALLTSIMTEATVTEYNEEMYEVVAAQVRGQYEGYMEYFNTDSIEDIYALFGLSDEDIQTEILSYVYERVIIEEIGIQEKIGVSEDEYQSALEEYAAMDEAENIEEYEAEIGPDNLKFWILEGKVLDFLVKNAKITEVEGVMEDSSFSDDSYDDDWENIDDEEDTEEYKG